MSKKKVVPADDVGKKNKKGQEPQTRQERRAQGKEKKGKKETTKRDRAALVSAGPGLTLAQLNAMNPPKKPAGRPAEDALFEKDFWEAFEASLYRQLGIEPATEQAPEDELSTESSGVVFIRNEEGSSVGCNSRCILEESIQSVALQNTLAAEVRRLLNSTQAIFDGLRISPEAAVAAAELSFEQTHENVRFAEILIADDPTMEIERLLDEVAGKVAELQLIGSATLPEYELGRAIELETLEPASVERLRSAAEEEAKRIGLRLRFEEIATGEGGGIDMMLAGIIGESAQEAEAERRKRAQFRQKLTHGLRQRKEKEGRRYSSSPVESGDEELVRFLVDHRGDLSAARESLPPYLREQVQSLLADEDRKGPILRQILRIRATAYRRWKTVKSRLLAGADRPEDTVAQNRMAISALRNALAEIGDLHLQLRELDKPATITAPPDYGASSRWKGKKPHPVNCLIAEAVERLLA